MESNGKIGCSNKVVKIVDPNDFDGLSSTSNVSVPLEDLNISVVLRTKRKGRTVLSSDGDLKTTESNGTVEINFIEGSDINGKKVLTSKFTDLTTIYDASFNEETLGISSIDIDFNPSMAPMITINFIDVRGSSIFQNEKNISGNNSANKYATFFQLPYPLFELEIKGYYGLPVTYCLHMLKFTTKFNSKTGNFEIQCQFIGYTYAMLSDMLIGYLRAIKETEIGSKIYKDKNDARKAAGGLPVIGLVELSQAINKINDSISQIGSESEASKTLNTVDEGLEALEKVKNVLDFLGSSLDIEKQNAKNSYEFILNKNHPDSESIIKTYYEDIDKTITKFNNVNAGYFIDVKNFKEITKKGTDKGFYSDLSVLKLKNPSEIKEGLIEDIGSENGYNKFIEEINKYIAINYSNFESSFDVYNMTSLYDELEKAKNQIEKTTTKAKEALALELKNTVREKLGFEPTVRNIVEIFTFAAEVFMETIYKVSAGAVGDVQRKDELSNKFKVELKDDSDLTTETKKDKKFHPWPDYREKDEKTNTFVEKYLGSPGVLENPNNVTELRFIDDLLKAFLKSKKTLDEVKDEEPEGAVWYPINPLDTNIFVSNEPYTRQELINKPDVITMAVIRGMTFLGYTNDFNSLSIEKEIIPMANLEAEAILRSIKDEKLKNSLGLVTLDSFADASNKINGVETKIITQYNSHKYYKYIHNYSVKDKIGDSTIIIPINDGFKGEWSKDVNSLRGRAQRGSVFLSNNPGLISEGASGKRSRYDNGGKQIQILTKEEYDKTIRLHSSETEINTESVLVLEKLKQEVITDPISAGFNVFGGPYGMQDFSKMDFGAKDLKDLPLRFVFFNDKPKGGGLALTRKATSAMDKVKFKTSDDYKENGIIVNNTSFGFYKDFSKNILHRNLTNNRRFFKKLLDGSKDITYPYIYVSVDALANGDDGSVSYGKIYDDDTSERKFSLFGSKFYYMQDGAKIIPKSLKKPYYTKEYARALLFLNSLPWIGNGFGVDGDKIDIGPTPGPDAINEIMHLFDIRGGFVHAPKLWCAYVGGILWRLDNGEPKIEDNKITGGGSTSADPISWFYDKDEKFTEPSKTEYFPSLAFNTLYNGYPQIREASTTDSGDILRRMPLQAVNEFKRIFFEFVNGGGSGITWNTLKSQLEIFNGSSSQFIKFMDDNLDKNKRTAAEVKAHGFNASRLSKLINQNNYSKILFESSDPFSKHNLFLELKDGSVAVNKILDGLLEEVIIVNTGFQAWKTKTHDGELIGNKDFEVVVSNTKFEKYFETIVKKLNEKANASSPIEEKKADEIELFGTANEDVIKLILYKNCKNIYDKWLAGVNDINKIIFQCGVNTRNKSDKEVGLKYGNTVPSLIDSFRFVSRSFKDIGDRLFINPIPVNDYLSNDQNTSLYDAVSSLLTDNKFTFEALPTFINFRDDKNVKAIFTPYGNYGESLAEGHCGPSFVCVYAGQPSKHLDFKKSEYQNDGFDLNCVSSGENGKAVVNPSVPDDFKDSYKQPVTQSGFENNDTADSGEENTETNGVSENISGSEDPIAVFTVRYGQQNQNIFKDVELDQSEFTETDESLQIQEEISQKGGENNRTIAGQNIYNVYSVRSYSAKVEMLGNAMIQPMMYFQLDNIPMFHGAYMVTRVQHSITPNNMKTTFTGTRIRYSETPLMTAYDLYMSFADSLDTSGAGSGGVSVSGGFIPRYKADLVKNKPKDTIIIGTLTDTQKNSITKRAQQEIKNWQDGKLKERNGTQFLDVYAKATPGFSGEDYATGESEGIHWSAVFISYIMLGGDLSFPKSTSHHGYITSAMNGKAGYEVFPFKSGLKIKVERGDIFNKPRSGGPTASHSDVVYSVSGEKAYLVGGNVSDSVKKIELKLKNGYIDDSVDVGDYVLIMKQTSNKYYNSKKLLGTGDYSDTNGGYTGAKKAEDLKTFSLTLKSVYTASGYKDDWSAIAANFIATKESYSPKATKDAGTYRGGYGTDKKLVNGALTTVTSTTTFTEKEAIDTLRYQIAGSYSKNLISKLGQTNWDKLNKHQKAALVSLSWNAGSGYINKPYGKEIKDSISENDFNGAAQGILNGPVTSDGKVLKGLQIRREQEAQLFLYPKTSAISYS